MSNHHSATGGVLYFVEHVARELDIACAIRRLLERSGLQVRILSLAHDLDRIAHLPRPRAIVVPYFYSRQDAGVKRVLLRSGAAPIVNLAFEQLFSRANQNYKRPRDDVARRCVLHCAAGEFFRQFLRSSGVPDENIKIIGGLAAALCRPPYRQYFENRREILAQKHHLPINRRWLFFPENYAAAFFHDKDRRQRIRGGMKPEELDQYIRFTRRSFEIVMGWLAEAAEHGLAEVILRPRPATPRLQFVQAVQQALGRDLPNRLHIIKEGSVREWLLASDLTASSYSSTIVEASAAGKSVCLASPLPIPDCVLADWNSVAPQARTREEFLTFITGGEQTAGKPTCDFAGTPLAEWVGANLLAHGDPIQNAAQLIEAVAYGRCRAPLPPPPPPTARFRDLLKTKRRSIKESLRFSKSADRRGAFSRHEQDAFTAQQADLRTADWTRFLALADQR